MKLLAFLAIAASFAAAGCGSTNARKVIGGDTAAVARMLDEGTPVDRVYGGQTYLTLAAAAGRVETVKLLLSRGADPFAKDPHGRTAQNWALRNRHPEAARLLREAEANARGTRPEDRGRPGNLDDAAYDRMRAAANMPPERRTPVSDVDVPSRRGAPRPDDFALVIGIEKYSRLPEARFAENDADAMKKHLLALGYPERNIILLKGGQATRGAIQGYIEEWLPRNAKPGSRVLVYFSGHGSPDAKSGDAYLVPWDGDAMFLKSTAYPLKSLYASLGKLKAKRVLVALDSCFSGAGGRSVLAEGARPLVTRTEEVAAPAGVTVLSAASGDEITATIKEQGHGAFTYYLLKAFNNGKLTARAAYDELKPSVQDEARRQNREQTPLLLGDDAAF